MTDTAQATTTVSDEMIEAGAKALLLAWQGADTEALFEDQEWCESYQNGARLVIEAALAAAPPPAPSELEQAIAECEANRWEIALRSAMQKSVKPVYRVSLRDASSLKDVGRGHADNALTALRQAMTAALAAGRSAGEGTSDE